MEEKNKNLKLIILIVVLFAISLGLGGYIIYDKVIDKEPVPNNNGGVSEDDSNNQEPVPNNNGGVSEDDSNNQEQVTVVTAYEVNEKYDRVGTANDCFGEGQVYQIEVNIKIPKIDSSKTNAQTINSQIEKDYERIMQYVNNPRLGLTDRNAGTSTQYEYIIKNDIIYIYIKGGVGRFCSSGDFIHKNYFYDIKNDKALTMEEAFTSLGFSIEDLRNLITDEFTDESYKNDVNFDNCENNSCGCGLEINNGIIKPFYNLQCV